MAETEKPLDIKAYVGMALRRKWYIVIPLVASVFISFGVYKYLPKIYKATTLILVQPQKVPEAYVRSIITAPITERLNTISQEILSRTSLEKVIKEAQRPEFEAFYRTWYRPERHDLRQVASADSPALRHARVRRCSGAPQPSRAASRVAG